MSLAESTPAAEADVGHGKAAAPPPALKDFNSNSRLSSCSCCKADTGGALQLRPGRTDEVEAASFSGTGRAVLGRHHGQQQGIRVGGTELHSAGDTRPTCCAGQGGPGPRQAQAGPALAGCCRPQGCDLARLLGKLIDAGKDFRLR